MTEGAAPELSPEMRKIEVDREIRLLEIKAGVKKVVYGTTIVGVAAAFFPFAQQTAISLVSYLSSESTGKREAKQKNQDFLESLRAKGSDPTLEERIKLAEFYSFLTSDTDGQKQWQEFLAYLQAQQKVQRDAEIEAVRVALDKASTAEQIATADAESKQLIKSAETESFVTGEFREQKQMSFHESLALLQSHDIGIRRGARSALAARGLELIRPALLELTGEPSNYRTTLGLLVALAEMMRENKHLRSQMIELIDDQGLQKLIILSTNSDRTIRIHATEFLSDLGDPRAFEFVGKIWDLENFTFSAEEKFSLAFILKGAAPYVVSEMIGVARTTLGRMSGTVGTKTQRVIDEANGLLP